MNHFLLFIGGLLAVVLGALFAVPYFVDWNGYRGVFEEEATRLLGREVRVGGEVNLRLLPAPFVRFEKIRIADPSGTTGEPFVRADNFRMWLSVPPLLRGVLEANEVELTRPELRLGLEADGGGNWRSLSIARGALAFVPADVTLHSVRIVDGTVKFHAANAGELASLESINGELSADALEGPYKFNGSTRWRGSEREVRFATGPPGSDGAIQFKAAVRAIATGNTYMIDGRFGDLKGRPWIDGQVAARVSLDPTPEAKNFAGQLAEEVGVSATEHPTIDVKAKFTGDAMRFDFEDIALNFENMGAPQLLAGSAKASWADKLKLDVAFASRWLDLDRLAGAAPGTGPVEIARGLGRSILDVLPPGGTSRARLDLDQVNLGGDPVSGLRLDVAREGNAVEVKQLSAGFPGGARIELSGALAGDKSASFDGTFDLRGASLSRFLSWAAKDKGLGDVRSDGPFSLQGKLALSDETVEIVEGMAELNGIPVKGEVRLKTAGRRLLAVTLEGNRIDAGQLGLGGIGLDTFNGLMAGAAAAEPEGSPEKAEDAQGHWFDPKDSDFKLRLRIGQLVLAERMLRDIDADVGLDGGKLSIHGVRFVTEDGLELKLDGAVSEVATEPRGDVNWLVAAPSRPAVTGFLRLLELSDNQRATAEPVATLAPLRLAGTLRFGARGKDTADLALDGAAAGGRVVAGLRLDGALSNWRSAFADLTATVDSPDIDRWLDFMAARGPARAADSSRTPRHGRITLKAAGVPETGLLTALSLKADGLSLDYDGNVAVGEDGSTGLGGEMHVSANDVTDVTRLAGLRTGAGSSTAAVEGVLDVASSGGVLDVKPRQLRVAGAGVAGWMRLTRTPDKPLVVSADVGIDEAAIPNLLAVMLDRPAAAASDGGDPEESDSIWPEEGFDFSALNDLTGEVTARFGRLDLQSGFGLRNARFTAALSPGRLQITKIEGEAAGGRLEGTLTFQKSAAAVDLTGALHLQGARIGISGEAGAAGPAAAGIEFSSRAQGPGALIAGLTGKGQINLGDVRLSGLTPNAVARAAENVLMGKADGSGEALAQALRSVMAGGQVVLGPSQIPVEVADGALRVKGMTLETKDGRTQIVTTVDLGAMKIDSEWRIEAMTRPEAGRVKLPAVSVVYVAPLKDLASVEPRIATGELERELSVRGMERNVEQLEKLRKLDEESARREQERLRALDAERARATETAPPDSAPAGTQEWDAPVTSTPPDTQSPPGAEGAPPAPQPGASGPNEAAPANNPTAAGPPLASPARSGVTRQAPASQRSARPAQAPGEAVRRSLGSN